MADRPIEWMSSGEAADYLGVGLRTLYKFIDDGKLAGYRFGRVIRLKQSDLEIFIDVVPHRARHPRAPPGRGPSPQTD